MIPLPDFEDALPVQHLGRSQRVENEAPLRRPTLVQAIQEKRDSGIGEHIRVGAGPRRIDGGVWQHKMQQAADSRSGIVCGEADARTKSKRDQHLAGSVCHAAIGHLYHDFVHLPSRFPGLR